MLSNLGDIDNYVVGYRFPFMTSRDGFAFHNDTRGSGSGAPRRMEVT